MQTEYTFDSGTTSSTFVQRHAYFGGKRVGQKEDCVGTVQNGGPVLTVWGGVAGDLHNAYKFGTYYRDQSTEFDCAMSEAQHRKQLATKKIAQR